VSEPKLTYATQSLIYKMMREYHTLNEVHQYETLWMPEDKFREASMQSVRDALARGYLIRRSHNQLLNEYQITDAGIKRLEELEDNPYRVIRLAYDDLHLAWMNLINARGGLDDDVIALAKALELLKNIVPAADESEGDGE